MYLKSTLLHFTDKHEIGTKYSSSAGQCFWRDFTFFLPKTQELSNNLRLRILWNEEVRVCLSQKMIPTFFLYHSEVWGILHHQSMRPIHWRILLIAFIHCFPHFSVAFHRQLCVFLIFISFLHELSNLRSRILCNQIGDFQLSAELCFTRKSLKCFHLMASAQSATQKLWGFL